MDFRDIRVSQPMGDRVKRQNSIDFFGRGIAGWVSIFDRIKRWIDKRMIEKNENDRQIGRGYDGRRQETTELSMWITLWKLGISQPFLDGFEKNGQ